MCRLKGSEGGRNQSCVVFVLPTWCYMGVFCHTPGGMLLAWKEQV